MEISKFPKYVCMLVLAILICASSSPLLSGNQNQDNKEIEVYFAYPTSTDENEDSPEKITLDYLHDLKEGDTLYLAMYSLTDRDILLAIRMAAQNGAVLRFYLDRTPLHEEEYGAPKLEEICKAGDVEVRVGNPLTYRMNHKFAVINNQTVITGSYSWSHRVEENDWGNLLVIKDKETVNEFTKEFLHLWHNYSEKVMKCGG